MRFEIKVEDELCTGCGNCSVACPINALELWDVSGGKGGGVELAVEGGKAFWLDSTCNGCGVCIRACASDALSLMACEQTVTDRALDLAEVGGVTEEEKAAMSEETVAARPTFKLDPKKKGFLEKVLVSMKKTKPRRLVETGKFDDAKERLLKVKEEAGGKE
ncbi:MAG: ATP-binding protein [Candidatus Hydrothermarchaeaceae archaeon]